jgi:DNA transformation protein
MKEISYRDFVLNQLRSLEGVTCRAMFGGYGLYLGADQVLKSYFEVPEEIVEDDEELATWAREAATRKGKRKGRAPVAKKR